MTWREIIIPKEKKFQQKEENLGLCALGLLKLQTSKMFMKDSVFMYFSHRKIMLKLRAVFLERDLA